MEPEADEFEWQWEWKQQLDEMEEHIEFRGEKIMAESLRHIQESRYESR